jgi:hypothetical protein
LTLKVLARSCEPRHRTCFDFAPHDDSPGKPLSSFMVVPVIDTNGGRTAETPVDRLWQPPGSQSHGLNGCHGGGGKTFSFGVVGSCTCASTIRFTLLRVERRMSRTR